MTLWRGVLKPESGSLSGLSTPPRQSVILTPCLADSTTDLHTRMESSTGTHPAKSSCLDSTLDIGTTVPNSMPSLSHSHLCNMRHSSLHVMSSCICSVWEQWCTTPQHNIHLSVRQQGERNEHLARIAKRVE